MAARLFSRILLLLALPTYLASLPTLSSAERLLQSNSLNTCQAGSGFAASLFKITFTPSNSSAYVDIVAVSSIQGNVVFDLAISAYGLPIIRKTINPCDIKLAGLCPMTSGKIPLEFALTLPPSASKQVPGIAYSFPDLDASVRVYINMTSGPNAGKSVACVEAEISNGKTVDLNGVKWATAIIALLALASSAVVAGLGHTNAASHIAANSVALFGYFQAQAMIGLTAVPLPPVVQSWTQDFQWSMGIIRVGWMQKVFTWYQRATGGKPASLLNPLINVSVEVDRLTRLHRRRALVGAANAALGLSRRAIAMMPRSVTRLAARTALASSPSSLSTPATTTALSTLVRRSGNTLNNSGSYVVAGLQRVAYRAHIEITNLFMTGLTFFFIFLLFTTLAVAAFKGFCELAARRRWMQPDTFLDFRNGWFTVLKGILFRVTLISFPQLTILCLWEFTQNDSPAEIVLAVFSFFGMAATLAWAASKVVRIARRSVAMHRNPAYILFSDPQALNKWGFLYIQFRASAYYFVIPVLVYLLVKGAFVAFAQSSGTVQAIAFVLIEAAALIAACVLRPWMDKPTNSFNIAICVVNFLNAIFLLIFTEVFHQPPIVTGVIGLVLWIINAVFSLILLILLIVSTLLIFFRKNPDNRYVYMADDRASFMKSATQLSNTTELDALAATARGDGKHLAVPGSAVTHRSFGTPGSAPSSAGGTGAGSAAALAAPAFKSAGDHDDDSVSISSDSLRRRGPHGGAAPMPFHAPTPPPHVLSGGNGYMAAPMTQPRPRSPGDPSVPLFGAGASSRSVSPYASPSPTFATSPNPYRPVGNNSSSPWQRGAGYDR